MHSSSQRNISRGRPRLRRTLATAIACTLAGGAAANPSGMQVVAGQVSTVSSANQLLITNSPGTILNWQSFSILPGELTQFIQQSASSAVLNRITGQDPSKILGALRSNGKVLLINPNGILFGAGSRVDVNGLVATSLDLSNADFLAGHLKFSSAHPTGNVINSGAITTPSGGQVYLIAPNVTNDGIITSPNGDVMLAAGRSVDLADSNDPDLRVVISAPGNEALNVGKVVAASGRVGVYGALVDQMGLVSANSAVAGENGKILFKATDTTLLGAASVTTATGAGNGGVVEVLGNRVGLVADSTINANGRTGGGTVLIGGDTHGDNPSVQNSSLTYVSQQASIQADALDSGNGGKVVVWSDQQTKMYGSISARGGQRSGAGGFVETSSANRLDFQGQVDLRASHGTAGTLLLDPSDVTIDSATSSPDIAVSGTGPFTIAASNPSSILSVTALENQLGLGNVTVTTSSGAAAPRGGTITVAAPVSWATANSLTLAADQGININASVTGTAGQLVLTTAHGNITQALGGSQPAAISVVSLSASAPDGSVALNEPANNITGVVAGIGSQGFSLVDSGPIALGTLDSVAGISSSNGTVSLMAAGGDITQSAGPIVAPAVSAVAANGNVQLNEADNQVGVVAGSANGLLGFSLVNKGGFSVGTAAGAGGTSTVSGITVTGSMGSGVVLQSSTAGDINLDAPVNAGSSSASISTAGAVSQGSSGLITAGKLTIYAGSIGSSAVPLVTNVATIGNVDSQGSVYINNGGDVVVNFINASGVVAINSAGSLSTPTAIQCDCTRSITGTSVTLTAGGLMFTNSGSTISASGPVSLVAGYPAAGGGYVGSNNTLTVNGDISAATVGLTAGGAIGVNGVVTGTLTQAPNQYSPPPTLPTLDQCIATPSLLGCSAVLPSLAACTFAPAAPGCNVVLPTLAACTATPTAQGCTVVLPSLAQCAATPSAAGCSVVLPSLAACTTTPTAPGCSVVLPTLGACTATPTAQGCSVVLPSLAQCTATPSVAGCAAVLPTVAQCTSSPGLPGCPAAPPSADICAISPNSALCAILAPSSNGSPVKAASNAVIDTLNTTVSTLSGGGSAGYLSSLTAGSGAGASNSSGSGTASGNSSTAGTSKSDTTNTAATSGAKSDESRKKLYCN